MAPHALESVDPFPQELVTEATDLETWVKKTSIKSQTSYDKASARLGDFQRLRRTIQAHFAAVKSPINAALKDIRAMEKAELAKIAPSEERLKALILTYDAKQREARDAAVRDALTNGTEITPPTHTRPAGQSIVTTKRTALVDVPAFIAAVARGDVPMEVVTAEKVVAALEVELNKLRRSHGDLFSVPGVVVQSTDNVVDR